jgi:hypothetical protein
MKLLLEINKSWEGDIDLIVDSLKYEYGDEIKTIKILTKVDEIST